MKRPMLKAAGILNTLLFIATFAAEGYLIYLGVQSMLATLTIAGSNTLAAVFAWIMAVVSSILLLVGLVAFVYSIIMLVTSAKIIKYSKMEVAQFKRRTGGIVAYLVFCILTVVGAVFLAIYFQGSALIFYSAIAGGGVLLLSVILMIAQLSKKEVLPPVAEQPVKQ